MQLEELGLVGNCQFAALIHAGGDVVWCCLPKFDSEPVFGQLLDPKGGRFGISTADGMAGRPQLIRIVEPTGGSPVEDDLRGYCENALCETLRHWQL